MNILDIQRTFRKGGTKPSGADNGQKGIESNARWDSWSSVCYEFLHECIFGLCVLFLSI
jgi:hypothetical protein